MTVINTIDEQIGQITSNNQLYDDYKDRWQFLLESYLGGEEYRQGNHLTRYTQETGADYVQRLRATYLQNHANSVINVYNSFMFREPPYRDFYNWTGRPDLESFLEDCDYDDRSLDAFMKDVATWASVFGHCWIIMAKANIGAVTAADEEAAGVRPYVSLVTPLVTLDWRYGRDPSGRYRLDYIKYIEDINGSIRTVKEWTPETVTTYVVDLESRSINEQYTETNGLGIIPAVLCYNQRSMVKGIGVSDISDIADAQRAIYNCNSEIEQSIRIDSHPSLVKTPETEAGIGAGSIIHMPDNLDSGLKPYILEYNGASVQSILSNIQNIENAIDKMANTGGVRATETRTLSGVAMETEFQLLNARLSEKAANLELAEEHLWMMFAMYQGLTGKPEVKYPSSFNIRDTQTEINQLQTAKNTATSPQLLRAIDAELAEWLGVEHEELVEMSHETTDESNRSDHIQQMIMEGYEDSAILEMHPEISQADIDTAKRLLLNQ